MAPTRARALFDYDAKDDSELSFKQNDVLYVHHKDDSGWWECEILGRIGFAPWNYLQDLPVRLFSPSIHPSIHNHIYLFLHLLLLLLLLPISIPDLFFLL